MEFQNNEKIIKVFYKPIIVYFFHILASGIIILGACFFVVPLYRLVLFHQTWVGKAIFWFLIFLGSIFLIRTLVLFYDNRLILTDQRLIIVSRTSFFSKKIFKIDYNKIKNVYLSFEGFFPTIFKLGTIEICLEDSLEKIKFSNIKKANEIQELIIQFQQKIKDYLNLDQFNEYELIKIARKIKEKIGRDIFKQIAEE
jgi:hypothetical protein